MTSMIETVTAPQPPRTDQSEGATCRCGHSRRTHEHYRRGKDCAECGSVACPRFRDSRGLLGRLLGGIGRRLRRR
jgi:hypothetical protein